jgi:hypothetical protein
MKKFLHLLAGLAILTISSAQARDIVDGGDLSPTDRNNWQALQEWSGRGYISICGDATTINNNTVYYGPGTTLTANIPWGQNCDITAAGNTTEATADAPALTKKAFRVLGMMCRNQADQDADISYTFRNATKFTTPKVTCTIADGERDCIADQQPLDIVAAGAAIAIAAASTANVGASKGFTCTLTVAY